MEKEKIALKTLALKKRPCTRPCTKTIKFMTDRDIPANTGISIPPSLRVDGYSYLHIFVEYDQYTHTEGDLTCGLIYSFDGNQKMGARSYVNLDSNSNIATPQLTNMITVKGVGEWHGSPHNKSSYMFRIPVMGPYVQVFPFNTHSQPRKVSIWGYLVA